MTEGGVRWKSWERHGASKVPLTDPACGATSYVSLAKDSYRGAKTRAYRSMQTAYARRRVQSAWNLPQTAVSGAYCTSQKLHYPEVAADGNAGREMWENARMHRQSQIQLPHPEALPERCTEAQLQYVRRDSPRTLIIPRGTVDKTVSTVEVEAEPQASPHDRFVSQYCRDMKPHTGHKLVAKPRAFPARFISHVPMSAEPMTAADICTAYKAGYRNPKDLPKPAAPRTAMARGYMRAQLSLRMKTGVPQHEYPAATNG